MDALTLISAEIEEAADRAADEANGFSQSKIMIFFLMRPVYVCCGAERGVCRRMGWRHTLPVDARRGGRLGFVYYSTLGLNRKSGGRERKEKGREGESFACAGPWVSRKNGNQSIRSRCWKFELLLSALYAV